MRRGANTTQTDTATRTGFYLARCGESAHVTGLDLPSASHLDRRRARLPSWRTRGRKVVVSRTSPRSRERTPSSASAASGGRRAWNPRGRGSRCRRSRRTRRKGRQRGPRQSFGLDHAAPRVRHGERRFARRVDVVCALSSFRLPARVAAPARCAVHARVPTSASTATLDCAQRGRRRLVRHGMARRLALAPQPALWHAAARPVEPARVQGEAARGDQADEEGVRRRLGRVSEAQGAQGAYVPALTGPGDLTLLSPRSPCDKYPCIPT